MDFTLTDDQKMIRDAAREFADREIAPYAATMDREKTFPREIMRKLAALGFLGILVPEEYGGTNLGDLALALVGEEINRACAGTGVTFSVQNSLVCSPIVRHANEAQKKKYLPKLVSGEWIGAYALSEPGAGSDAAALTTRAERKGDEWVLNGAKAFITNGGNADLYIVFARTAPDPSLRAKGISAFFVEAGTPGFRVGKLEDKMGIRASSCAALHFDDCRVPAENLLGIEGKGFVIAMDTLDGGRIGIATQAVGIAQACLDASRKYAKERRQFGQALAEFQAIQWKIAQMAMNIEAARLLTWRAAAMRAANAPHVKEAAMAKLFASSICQQAATDAVQIHGGVGYTKEFPVERYFRDAKITEIYEGTSEILHIVISRRVMEE